MNHEKTIKFHIIENSEPDYNLEEVIKDYLNTELSTTEIKQKHKITTRKYTKILNEIKKRGLPLRNTKHNSLNCKYYYFNKGYWFVKRVFNQKTYYFGTYKSEEEAKARVKELRENNWNGLEED